MLKKQWLYNIYYILDSMQREMGREILRNRNESSISKKLDIIQSYGYMVLTCSNGKFLNYWY